MTTKPPRGHRMTPLDHSPDGVAYALRKSGLSQKELAAAVGRSQSLISEVLKGTRNATPRLIADMAAALNCPVVVLEAKTSERAQVPA